MLHADIERRLRYRARSERANPLPSALHEASHAIAAFASGGRVTSLTLSECRTTLHDWWHQCIVAAAGPAADLHFGRTRDRITSDHVNVLAAARKVDPADVEAVVISAEAAARSIVVGHERAVRALAGCLCERGELYEDEVEALVETFRPFSPPPPPPIPAEWEQVLSRVRCFR